MNQLPVDLLAALPDGAGPVAERWWASLPEADRRRIVGLWDERLEVSFFAPQADDAGRVDGWEQVPAVRGGRFAPPDDDGRAEWGPGYFEHLLQHPELVIAYEPPRRTFYLCTQHPAARACVAAGGVPADFACPVGSEACPMQPLRGSRLTRRLAPVVISALLLAAPAPAGVAPFIPRVPADVVVVPEPAEPDDPAAIADRIAQNTKAVGDRLRDHDAGDDTRKTQDRILKDIDELLKQAQNPPPTGGGGGGGGQPPPDGANGGSSGGGQSQGKSGQQPGGDSGGSNGQSRPGGGSKSSAGGQPRAGDAGGSPKPGGGRRERRQARGEPGPGQQPGGNDPQPAGAGKPEPGNPGQPGGAGGPGTGGQSTPALPFDDALTKQVWGHLPETLRQQMTQYYREQFVSKYGDLLKDYYSTLAEREKAAKK